MPSLRESVRAISVQAENAIDRFDLRGLYQPRVSDGHRMEPRFKLLFPKIEKLFQNGKMGAEIVFLPKIGLQ